MVPYCQMEHVDSDSDTGTPCSNRAVAECADCGAALTLNHVILKSHERPSALGRALQAGFR
jgi:hypothetical protein